MQTLKQLGRFPVCFDFGGQDMKLKGLVLGAAGLFAVTGAQAADLPPAPHPVDYVRICDAFGSGFFYIPGTDSCLRLRGRLRVEGRIRYQDEDQPVALQGNWGNRNSSPLFFRARGYWGWDHRTNTDIGLVRAFFRGFIDKDTGDGGGTSLHMDYAFIQIGGLTVGFSDLVIEPVWSGYTLEHSFSHPGFEDETVIAQYVYSFGNGFSVGAVILDPSTGSFGTTLQSAGYGGLRIPSAGAAITYDGTIGTFRLAGIVQDIRPAPAVGADHDIGWGVAGSADVGIPFGTNTRFGINAQYADGIVKWLHDDLGGGGFGPLTTDFGVNAINGNTETTQGWSVGAGVTTQIFDRTTFNISGGYTTIENDVNLGFGATLANVAGGVSAYDEVSWWEVAANVQYQLTSNLVITLEGHYRDLSVDAVPGAVAIADSDAFTTILRAQLDF
jgi:opacity protein-like surface antigen